VEPPAPADLTRYCSDGTRGKSDGAPADSTDSKNELTAFASPTAVKNPRMEAFETSLRLDLSLLRGLRHTLAAWLDTAGVADEARESIVLATHEAAVNAIEHAELGTEVAVRGVRDDAKLIVVVANTGKWRKPRSADEMRGRGLVLMEQLMSDVEIHVKSGRTTVRMRKDLS
jgi:anti-sigma regulatory factor (Ser/Thr protein kinase)